MTDRLQPAGEALSSAIWDAAWFAVDKQHSKAAFVAMVIKAANETFDAQANNAAFRARELSAVCRALADALEGMPK